MKPSPASQMLADVIYQARTVAGLTQEEYANLYGVSGPAIFKFEKGYVRPSFRLWSKMAADAGIPERRAVLLWLKAKLPEEYQHYVDLTGATPGRRPTKGTTDYARFETREEAQGAVRNDRTLPKTLRDLLTDDELWSLYRPTGHEINMLRDLFAPLGKGKKHDYADALRLIREFSHSF